MQLHDCRTTNAAHSPRQLALSQTKAVRAPANHISRQPLPTFPCNHYSQLESAYRYPSPLYRSAFTVQSTPIIGVDPALTSTGYGLVRVDDRGDISLIEGGVIRTKPSESLEARLAVIHQKIIEILHEFKPEAMAIESLHSRYRNLKTAIIMGHARGAVVLAGGQLNIPVHDYPPTRVKSIVAGNGRAGKPEMLAAVKLRLRLNDALNQYDVADALGVAICHAQLATSTSARAANLPTP